MTNALRTTFSILIVASACLSACGSERDQPANGLGVAGQQGESGGTAGLGAGGGNASATGGTVTASGGMGGTVGAGGSSSTASGGIGVGTGGSAPVTGGNSSTGGSVSTGGSSNTGGSVLTTGGSPSTGDAGTGGSTVGTGGSTVGTGGTTADGGTSGSAGTTGGAGTGGEGASSGLGGQAETGGTGGTGTGGAAGSGGAVDSPLPPVDNYSDPGPLGTTTEGNTGPDGTYTIIRPDPLGEGGYLHAPIAFGPGIGMQVSQMSGLLERFASHGFIVIGKQLDGGPGDAENRSRMTNGLDWIIEQNSTPGSVFEGQVDVQNAIAMGYSVGGTAAVEVGGHEAVATVVSIHGHEAEGDLHGPLLLIGGTNDIMSDGRSWLAPTYDASQVQTFFGTVVGADHGYIQGSEGGVPGGVETPAIVAWMRYWIYDDQDARSYFFGDDCVACSSPWTEPQRKNWE